ncbi:synaptopodin 2-like protein isoform X15 [Eriocheir sinensis]|uniref:synaptopodin 2-like protein isoform X15 n=1 Tax=Eriocheir sinensis TaxID=95602 RepID=UPI0021CA728D|nr:synaptopodin 2-like protein isoform X15 [Eriocheir sinensis]
MPSRGTVFVHVPLSHTFTIQVVGGDGTPFYVAQAGRTCGLREGDMVVGVNGASTFRWPLALLQQTLKKASRDVVFEVLREMGDSAASVGVPAGGAGLGAATLSQHHSAVTKAVHEAEDLPVVSENGKIDESCVESPQGAPARPASPPASPPCSESMAPVAAPDTEADGVLHHTWKPKGKYQVPKTVIQYEDIVPIAVPDVAFSLKAEPPKPAPPPPQPEPPKPVPQPTVEIPRENQNLTNGNVSPIEIPAGIPLLARILPKDHEEGDKKMISLERLFTPATDSGDLTPKRSPSKKAFASSSFYRPDHPTIDDQVELAQRISFSLVDENNKMSRGQSMYMKRKKRSMRWIHAGGDNDEEAAGSGEGGEGQEDDQTLKHPPARPASVPAAPQADTKKPPMKLLMSPKGVQDFQAVQEHYQALMDSIPTSPEVGKIVTEVQSPTGKGAELFAKRKKRMDKFIVDETTVQKAQTSATTTSTSTRTQQQQSISSTANDLALKKSAVEERNRQQQQILEQFLRSREESLTLVKSPWQAAMETGTPDAAFDDKRQKLKGAFHRPGSSERPELANTVVERADNKLAQAASWLEPPKPVSLMAAPLSAEVIPTPATPPTGPAAIYTAEVKVVQRSSLPPTPAPDVPRAVLSQAEKDKRNSLNFNLAAKGWGTYNTHYKPMTFAT